MPQSLSNILLHLTFSTKERRLLLPYDPLRALHKYAAGIFKEQKCHMIEMNNVSDHVHILFELHRTTSVADVVMHVKKGTSRHLKELSQEYADFDWQEGYGVFSLGASQRDATQTYVRGQQEHHRSGHFRRNSASFLRNMTSSTMSDTCGVEAPPHAFSVQNR